VLAGCRVRAAAVGWSSVSDEAELHRHAVMPGSALPVRATAAVMAGSQLARHALYAVTEFMTR